MKHYYYYYYYYYYCAVNINFDLPNTRILLPLAVRTTTLRTMAVDHSTCGLILLVILRTTRFNMQQFCVSLYSFNWLVFITETECVYCAVRTESLNIIQVKWPRCGRLQSTLGIKVLRRLLCTLTPSGHQSACQSVILMPFCVICEIAYRRE
jgi:hypothetical protein